MFTGLVQECARLLERKPLDGGKGERLRVLSVHPQAGEWAMGASIAFNGVCLTLVAREKVSEEFISGADLALRPGTQGWALAFDVSPETLACTNLGSLQKHDALHLEPSLGVGDPLGGHLVSGHVDAVAQIWRREKVNEFEVFEFELEGVARAKVAPYLVPKGSVAVDGVSLTVNGVRDTAARTYFDVMLIPHTLELTRFRELPVGARVNLEADLVAKYVTRHLEFRKSADV